MNDLPFDNWIHTDEDLRSNYRAGAIPDIHSSFSDQHEFSDGWFVDIMPDLNQNNKFLSKYFIQNTIWWIEYLGLDGLRIDTYAYSDTAFTTELNKTLHKEYPNLTLLGETWLQNTPLIAYFQGDSHISGDYNSNLNCVTDFQMYYSTSNAFKEQGGWTTGLARLYYTFSQDFLYSRPEDLVIFLDNHDLDRFFSTVDEDIKKYKMGLAFLMTSRGIPSMYYGTEIAMSGQKWKDDGFLRKNFPGGWDNDSVNVFTQSNMSAQQMDIFNYVKNLANWRKNCNAVTQGKLLQFIPQDNVYVFFRYTNDEAVMTDPEYPFASQSVTIYFDAAGTDLEGYSGDVYAHTGVKIEGNSNWQHVIGSWGNNSTQPKLTKVSNNYKMAFVFRSADGKTQSADIFVDVYPAIFDADFSSPSALTVFSLNDYVPIKIVSLLADTIQLFVADTLFAEIDSTVLEVDVLANIQGLTNLKARAVNNSDTVFEEAYFFVRKNNVIADLPPNMVDGINYIDNSSVILVLYAPYKDFVFLKGDFNNWTLDLNYQMNKTSDGKRYWLQLSGLNPGQEYAYQYFVDGEFSIADPYTDKVLDPWNDAYCSSVYPGLKPYPANDAEGIVSVFQTAQTPYNWIETDFKRPKNENLIIYELLVRDFLNNHSYQGLIHSYGQSPLVQLYLNRETWKVTAENPWYNVNSPNTAYSWGYDFDHTSEDTRRFVDRALTYWLTEYKIDGFRFS